MRFGRVRLYLIITLSFAPLWGCGEDTTSENRSSQTEGAPRTNGTNTPPGGNSDIAAAIYQPRPVESSIAVTNADRAGHLRMIEALETLGKSHAKNNSYYGTNRAKDAERALREATALGERLGRWVHLATVEMDLGDDEAALTTMAEVERFFDRNRDQFRPRDAAELHLRLGMLYLRHGETQNCCLLHNQDSCVLPIRGGGVHTRQEGSRAAISEFEKIIEVVPRDSQVFYEAVWLWNLAAMTLGEQAQSVREPYRMAPERFLSKEDFPRLFNIASELGIDANSLAGSVVADDFNDDGYLDLMVGSWDLREQLRLYLNNGAGEFVDATSAAGLEGMCGGLNMVQGDYNNDGRIDVYILRGAWLFDEGRIPDSLLRNNGDGTFTDVTYAAGLAEENYPSQTASWSDYDLDGDLDLYVGRESSNAIAAPSQLFRNNGDGTFTDVAEVASVANNRFAKGVIWGDYNRDRYPDIYVSNLGGANRLYRNNGDGVFTDVAQEAGVADITVSFPTWFWDYDNDGVVDLFVASFDANMAHISRYYSGQSVDVSIPHVFRGTPSGKFVDESKSLGLDEPTLPMGCNFGDLDNDGFLDMYLGTGSPDFKMIMPNKLYHNHGGNRFADVSEAAGLSHLQKGHGVAFADFDADGDQDVFIEMGGAYNVDKYVDALYENPGFDNNWIHVELVGGKSNRFGVGSRIRVDVEDNGEVRSIYRWVNSGGSFGCNPLRQQIGVGQAGRIKRLEVYWPTTDHTQTFEDLPTNCIIRITEGADKYVETNLRPTSLEETGL